MTVGADGRRHREAKDNVDGKLTQRVVMIEDGKSRASQLTRNQLRVSLDPGRGKLNAVCAEKPRDFEVFNSAMYVGPVRIVLRTNHTY